jgi:hypothetical protein
LDIYLVVSRWNAPDGKQISFSNNKRRSVVNEAFILEAAKAGALVCTKRGQPVRLLCFDRKSMQPVVGLVEGGGNECPASWTKGGYYLISEEDDADNSVMQDIVKKEVFQSADRPMAFALSNFHHTFAAQNLKQRRLVCDLIQTVL